MINVLRVAICFISLQASTGELWSNQFDIARQVDLYFCDGLYLLTKQAPGSTRAASFLQNSTSEPTKASGDFYDQNGDFLVRTLLPYFSATPSTKAKQM